jgi:hypothetical protein
MPYQAWHGSKPAVQFLRTFGCLAYVKELGHRGKLEDRSTPGVFIGYKEGVKAYQVLDLVTQRVRTTRDVVFDEDCGWNWSQEEDGNTECNYDFVVEYLVDATVAAEESATPSSASPTSPGMSTSTMDSISSTSGGEATPPTAILAPSIPANATPSAREGGSSSHAAPPSARAGNPSTREATPSARAGTPSTREATPHTRAGTPSTREAAPSADPLASAAPSSSPTYGSNDSRLDNDHDDAPLRYRPMEDLLSEPHPGLEQVELEEAELILTSTGEPCSFAEAEREEAWRAAMRDEIN